MTESHKRLLLRVLLGCSAAATCLVILFVLAAIHFDIPNRIISIPVTLSLLASLGGILKYIRPWKHAIPLLWVPPLLILGWWVFLLRPSHDREWRPEVSQLPSAEISGDTITLRNVRDFSYETEDLFTARYHNREVSLESLEAVDFFLCTWGSPSIAHPIISFRFSDAPPVAFSIETRKEVGEAYSAVKGFFKQFELIYILAEERDVVRLRTDIREGEDVYLYRTTIPPDEARKIFLDYLRRTNDLYDQPEFYNAMTSNCTTNIRIHTTAATGNKPPWDWRIILNGTVDEMAWERGTLLQDIPFSELRERGHLNSGFDPSLDALNYSRAIRDNIPGF